MEPVTHALASLALARTDLGRITRFATPMLLVSGLAADLDWLTYAGGARDFLAGHRTATHSIVGTIVIAGITATLFTIFSRRLASHDHPLGAASTGAVHVSFLRACAVCAVGAATHVILDLTNSYGIKLLWPFQQKWYALDLAGSVDPLLLVILGAVVLVPVVFQLVTEEIGGRAPARKGQAGTIAALLDHRALFRWTRRIARANRCAPQLPYLRGRTTIASVRSARMVAFRVAGLGGNRDRDWVHRGFRLPGPKLQP